MVRVAVTERIRSQTFGGVAIAFLQEWREVLRVVLVLEAVNEVVARKLIRWGGVIAQQISNRIVVLAMRQSAEGWRGRRRCIQRLPVILHGLRQFASRKMRQHSYP